MRVHTLLSAVLLLGAAYLPTHQPNGELTDEEYEVLSAYCLRQMNLYEMACMIDELTWAAPLDKSVLAKVGPTSSLAQDYIRKNREVASLDAERVAKAFRREDGQRFSRVGFSARGDSALVQVLSGSRSQSYVLVKGRNDWWTVAHTVLSDEIYWQ